MASSVELRFGEIFLAIEEAKDADVHYKRLLTFVEDLVYSKTRPHPVHLTTPGYAKNVSRALIHLSGRVAEKSTGAKLKANSEIAFKALLLLVNEVPEMQDALVEMSVSALSDLRLHLHVLEGSEDDRKNALAFINLLKELSPKFHKLSTYVRKADEVKALLAEVKEADKTMKPIERRLSVEGFAAPQSGSFYDVPISAVAKSFGTDLTQGLSKNEVLNRRQQYGSNELPKPKSRPWWRILLAQVLEFMVLVLVAAAVASAAVQEYKGTVTLAIVIVVNTVIGFIQEYKAEKALSGLMSLEVPRATVIRDGIVEELPAADLVPGDLVTLDEGNSVPADLRMVEAINLEILEAVLTGESDSVHKHVDHIPLKNLPVGDRKNMAFMSTTVVKGRGTGLVVTIGTKTEAGKISESLAKAKQPVTPLQRRLSILGRWLVFIAVFLALLIIAIGLIRNRDAREMVLLGVSLGVSVIPEGLATVCIVTMALGVRRMAKKNAIVRQLAAVETLGSVSTICSDKTGTLTEGKMRATDLWVGATNTRYSIHGSGTEPTGTFTIKDEEVHPDKSVKKDDWLRRTIQCISLCNNSSVQYSDEEKKWERIGDPTEVALMLAAMKLQKGKAYWVKEQGWKFVHEIAFDSNRKRMSVLYKDPEGDFHVFVKGGLESVAGLCSGTKKEKKAVEKNSDRMAKYGLRVLTLAYKFISKKDGKSLDLKSEKVLEEDLDFLGLIGLIDPPRPQVAPAIQVCYNAGIRVCMITGDHQVTATSIAGKLGIDNPFGRAMRGVEIDLLAQEESLETLEPMPTVFARVSPENKLQIVHALQTRGEVVAMTGDGVNDAPAIKKSDVGVAMGITGTDITKSVASIVLRDDNFDTITKAVEEGRVIYDNIVKFILYLLSCNSAEILIVLISVIMGEASPFTTIQILVANIIADVPPAMALGIDPPEPDVMSRPPRPRNEGILNASNLVLLSIHGIDMCLIGLAAYLISLYGVPGTLAPLPLLHAQTSAWVTLTVVQIFHGLLARSRFLSVFHVGIFRNLWMVGAVILSIGLLVAVVYIPGLNTLLDAYPLTGADWLKVLIGVVVHTIISEVTKLIIRVSQRHCKCCGGQKRDIHTVHIDEGVDEELEEAK